MKILLADDDVTSRLLIGRQLQAEGFTVEAVADGDAAWAVLSAADPPAVAILDWNMPGLTGPELCRRVRAAQVDHYLYLILLTARTARADVLAGLQSGADDYLTKPVHPDELWARLAIAQRMLALHARLTASRDALRIKASHDSLTGLLNREAILDLLAAELTHSAGHATPLAIALCDVDHFKPINDTHGHAVGDAALQAIARRLRGALRTGDAIGRYGGEEFLILLPGCAGKSALGLCERLRAGLAAGPVSVEGLTLPVTVSLGIAALAGGDAAAGASLLDRADQALYQAKRAGRNCCVMSDPGPPR